MSLARTTAASAYGDFQLVRGRWGGGRRVRRVAYANEAAAGASPGGRGIAGQLLYWLERPLPADGTEPSYVYRVQFNDCAILAGCQDGRLLLWDFTEGIDPLLHC